jgi:tetratricopeptide (TPR) repeat protein
VSRTADRVVCQLPATNGPSGTVAIPVARIDRIEFPESSDLASAREAHNQGKTDLAISSIDRVLAAQQSFKDIVGNQWGEAAVLKLNILRSAGRHKDADPALAELLKYTLDPEINRAAKAHEAVRLAIAGQPDRALVLFDEVTKEATDPDTLALIALHRGNTFLARQRFEDALLSYMRLPVFYPNQKFLAAPALLGSARAFIGIDDLAGARNVLAQLIKDYPNLPEAIAARAELQKVERKLRARNPGADNSR